jgi:signal peptidase I
MKHAYSRKLSPGVWIGISVGVILFAGWLLVRTFVVAAYSLPTTSMEKTIHLGGKVLVDKLNYRPIKRGDIVVFHFPEGDTVINLPEYQSAQPYYYVIRMLGAGNSDSGRQIVLGNPDQYPLSIRPVDKREAYLKRCIAAAGDTLEVRGELVYINGRAQTWPPESETYFHVITNGQPLDEAAMKEQWGVNINNAEELRPGERANEYDMLLTWNSREKMLKSGFARSISPIIDSSGQGIFPNDNSHHWTTDNYGPLWVPRNGGTLQLTQLNYSVYERIIRTYEGNKLEIKAGKIYINGREATSYTFKMNYYWVIGDNLHGSQDSRYWGFVPEDHLIGKASTIL